MALPVGVAINGLAADPLTGVLYGTDSARGTVWRIPTRSGSPEIWSSDSSLEPGSSPTSYGFGANGIKVHKGAAWVSNSDHGTLLRFPVRLGGSAGPVEAKATGLTGVDDFSFAGNSDTVLAALNSQNKVALVKPDGTHTIVLTGQDGLQTPTVIAVRAGTAYVTSAAYFTQQDPNLLLADIDLSQTRHSATADPSSASSEACDTRAGPAAAASTSLRPYHRELHNTNVRSRLWWCRAVPLRRSAR